MTTGQSYVVTTYYRTPAQTVEWIQEATGKSAGISLAHYGTVTFTGLTNGGLNPKLKVSDRRFMLKKATGSVISNPSVPSAKGDAFSVAYGPKAPPAPTG